MDISPAALMQHARKLAAAFNVRLVEDSGASRTDAHSYPAEPDGEWAGMVTCHPVDDETSYAICLHEIGHIIAPAGMMNYTDADGDDQRLVRMKLVAERAAWQWAKHYAVTWTASMEQARRFGLGSYVRRRIMVEGRSR